MNTTPLRDAYDALLEASITVLGPDDTSPAPPRGEWDATQILAHIASVDAGVLATVYSVASGAETTYDNRVSLDDATLDRVTAIMGDSDGLRDRIRRQGAALCAVGEMLSEAELDTPVSTLFESAGVVQFDQPIPLKALLAGLAEDHLPRHTTQLLALLPHTTLAAATTRP
jgi:DinB superfamily